MHLFKHDKHNKNITNDSELQSQPNYNFDRAYPISTVEFETIILMLTTSTQLIFT